MDFTIVVNGSSDTIQYRRKIMPRNGQEGFLSEELPVLVVLHLVNLKLNLGKHSTNTFIYKIGNLSFEFYSTLH